MKIILNIWKWIQAHSWVNESILGALLIVNFMLVFDFVVWMPLRIFLAFVFSNAVSCFYESQFDRNGWEIADVLQRVPAMIIVLTIWVL